MAHSLSAKKRIRQTAKRNAQEAGVAGFLTLEKHDVAHAAPPPGQDRGLVITQVRRRAGPRHGEWSARFFEEVVRAAEPATAGEAGP